MLIEHQGKRPVVDPTAFVAPTAVLCGDVTTGPGTGVMFGAVVVAEGSPVRIGGHCIVGENVLVRSTARHAVAVGDYVLIGSHGALFGCTVEGEAFLATDVRIYHGAYLAKQSDVYINGIVHVNCRLPAGTKMPIAHVAVGDPAQVFPPGEHDKFDAFGPDIFTQVAYGMEPPTGSIDMQEVLRRATSGLESHRDDRAS
jgi:carbonic anhydrase/acetyltransferase-like protein (isoleucine patch superfamily)